MIARKWVVRLVVLAVLGLLGGSLVGCESTGGGGNRGSDGHAGHNH